MRAPCVILCSFVALGQENIHYRVWACTVLIISSLPVEGVTVNGRHGLDVLVPQLVTFPASSTWVVFWTRDATASAALARP